MSVSSVSEIIRDRITPAKNISPISVFKCIRGSVTELNAVFNSTFLTKCRIRNNDKNYIGTYYGVKGAKQFKIDTAKFA